MSLHTAYRPKEWDDVLGQDHVLRPLRETITQGRAHSFLFHGPSGTGKTTLARLCASQLGCTDLVEIDAATNTGVDAMRDQTASIAYKPMDGGNRAYILDECHRLSKQAWDSLLKVIEEPPAHAFWFLCTTEPTKVPKTVQTRCVDFSLRPLPPHSLIYLIDKVARAEGVTVPTDIQVLVSEGAFGSPRQALVDLEKVINCKTVEEAKDALMRAPVGAEAIDLARALFNPWEMRGIRPLLAKMRDESPESVRLVVYHYALTAALDKDNWYALTVLKHFEQPAIEANKIGDILSRVARLDYERKKK